MGDQTGNQSDLERMAGVLVGSVKDYAIFALDREGRVRTWNAGAQEIKQYAAQEIVGQHFSRFYTPEDVAAGKPMRLLKVAAEQGRVEDEGWRMRKDGSWFWADVVITPIRDSSGVLVGYLKVTRDLTERRRAEEALRQSEEKLRLMIASVQDYAIFMLDPEGRVTSWNPGAERLKGYRADEIIGSHFSVFYSPEEVAAGKPEHELEVATAVGRFEDEGWRLRKDGSRFWANAVLSAIRDERGRLVGFAKVTRDMTERKHAEMEIARQAVQQEAVAELGIHAIRARALQPLLTRAAGVVTRTLGTTGCGVFELEPGEQSLILRAGAGWPDELVGHVSLPNVPDSTAGFALRTGEAGLAGDVSTESDLEVSPVLLERGAKTCLNVVIPGLGEERPFGVLSTHATSPVSFSRDDVNFVRAIAHVIASVIGRMRDEEQLRLAEAQAEEERQRAARAGEALRERDVFLSVAAHELRTPLTALQLKLQVTQQLVGKDLAGSPRADTAVKRFDDALRQTGRLGELIERMLDVSRIAVGRLEMQPVPTDLESVVREVIQDFREKAIAARTEIRLSVSGDSRGKWDRHRLEQVALNLLSNAVKYGAGKPIDVRLEGRDSEVRLRVTDRGIGISASDFQRIFDPFERAAPVEHFAGLGLGLYITRHIVEAHGGRIEVSSSPGEGANFVVVLPRDRQGAAVSESGVTREEAH